MMLSSKFIRLLLIIPIMAWIPHSLFAMTGWVPSLKYRDVYTPTQAFFLPVPTPFYNRNAGFFSELQGSKFLNHPLVHNRNELFNYSFPGTVPYELAFRKKKRNSPSASDLLLPRNIHSPRHVHFDEVEAGRSSSGFMNTIGNSPGYALFASALLPGLGQAANGQWWKTAFFGAVEAAAIGIYIHRENRGRDGERYYQEYGNKHWSVVQYAQYIVDNHEHQHGYEFRELLTDEGRELYDNNGTIEPAYDTSREWPLINIQMLQDAERNSRYNNGEVFSHHLPKYGSQQYYELISKYFQFGPGWRSWDGSQHSIDNREMPEDFWYHSNIGSDFNTDLNVARNMIMVIVANHFIAAFDAYFTQQLSNSRISPSTSMEYGLRPTFGFDYRF